MTQKSWILRNLTRNKIIVYIPMNPKFIKIESNIVQSDYKPKNWRILINKNSPFLLEARDGFIFPIQLNHGQIVNFYDFFLSPFKKITQNSEGKDNPHPSLANLYKFVTKEFQNPKYQGSLNQLNTEDEKNWTILRVNGLNQQPFPGDNSMLFINPVEEDLLLMEDLTSIFPENKRDNFINISSKQIALIDTYLNKMNLNNDFPSGTTRSIRELIEFSSGISQIKKNKFPSQSGLVLYGPPGTGKTFLIEESLKEIFREGGVLDFNWHSAEIGTLLSNHYIGGFAAQITEMIFKPAIAKIKKNKKPCFIYVDEATDLLKKDGHEWLKQGIESMKSFINKKRYPGIIVCLASNMEKSDMDDALTRKGRLEPIEIPLPSADRCKQLWDFVNSQVLFTKGSNEKRFTDDQIKRLVNLTSNKINVSSITEISEAYRVSYNLPERGEIDFDKFIKRFGEEVIKIIKSNHEKEIRNFRNMNSGQSYFNSDEINEKINNENLSFKKRLHDIELALDPNAENSFDKIKNLFNKKIKNEEFLPKKYNDLILLLKKWKNELDKNSNPFENQSLQIISSSIEILEFLLNNLTKDFHGNLYSELDFILTQFKKIIEINSNKYKFESFELEDLNNLNNIIKNLPNTNVLFSNTVQDSTNLSKKDQNIVENIEKTFDWINSNFKILGLMYMKKYPKNFDINKFNTQFNNSLNYLFENIKIYYKFKKIETGIIGGKLRKVKKVIFKTIIIINNWKKNGYITPTEYSALIKYLMEIIELKK